VFWLAAAHVFRRKKAGEVLPDDLRRGIAKESFSSWIPAQDVSFSANEKNGVFPRVSHEEIEPLTNFLARKSHILGSSHCIFLSTKRTGLDLAHAARALDLLVQLGVPFGSADEKLFAVGELHLPGASRLGDDLYDRFHVDRVFDVVRR
jgi:hypothetical protein